MRKYEEWTLSEKDEFYFLTSNMTTGSDLLRLANKAIEIASREPKKPLPYVNRADDYITALNEVIRVVNLLLEERE